jgi:hypothetical protein
VIYGDDNYSDAAGNAEGILLIDEFPLSKLWGEVKRHLLLEMAFEEEDLGGDLLQTPCVGHNDKGRPLPGPAFAFKKTLAMTYSCMA